MPPDGDGRSAARARSSRSSRPPSCSTSAAAGCSRTTRGGGRRAAAAGRRGRPVAQGSVGAGSGPGGRAARRGRDGERRPARRAVVAALVVVNATGSAVDPAGLPYAARFGIGDEFARPPPRIRTARPRTGRRSRPGRWRSARGWPRRSASWPPTLTLTKAQCAKLAGVGHDGLARAVTRSTRPFDGDTLFALATGSRPAPTELEVVGASGRRRRLRQPGDRPRCAVGDVGRPDRRRRSGPGLRPRGAGRWGRGHRAS